jgi:hypothetical protein
MKLLSAIKNLFFTNVYESEDLTRSFSHKRPEPKTQRLPKR